LTLVPTTGTAGPRPALEDRSDDDLMLLARGGHPTAFDVLVRRYQARVLQAAGRRLGRSALARDVAQETFLKIFQTAHRYEARGFFCAYLFRVLLRECAMMERKAGAERRRVERLRQESGGGGQGTGGGSEPAPLPGAPGADELILAREQERELQRAIGRLSPKLRDAITLVFLAGLSYQQAAETLRVPMGTLKRRVFDGLEKLRVLTEAAA
jgi:RNA polymerase sigma-70 factor (ECF subfamily)